MFNFCFDILQVASDESSSDSSSEIRNSATEISTDSEFAHDDPTPTREIPISGFNDINVTKGVVIVSQHHVKFR